jgi:cell division protein FtsB
MTAITFYKQIAKDNQRMTPRHGITPRIKVGPATLGIVTIVIILLMSLLYLVQANSTATKGYEIEKQQERINTLDSQSEKLELEMAKLRSTKELDGLPEKLNLKPVEGEISAIQFSGAIPVVGIAPEPALNPKR